MTVRSEKKPYILRTQRLGSHFVFGPYVFAPLLAALVWLGGLLAMIGIWAAHGTPRYQPTEASIVFISDIGAVYQTLFICICVITSAFYILSLWAERWLRHVDRLPSHGDRNRRQVVFDVLAIIFCMLGSAALILLSCYNAFEHSTVHWSCTVIFIVCIALSAIFQSCEVSSLRKDHPDRAHLMRNGLFKLFIVFWAVALAIAFGVLYSRCHGDVDYSQSPARVTHCKRVTGAAAVLEWSIALIFDAYLLTIMLDLWPAGKSSPRYLRRLERWEQSSLEKMGVNNPHHANGHVGMVDQRNSSISTSV